MQEAPIHQNYVYGRIKISQTIFEKGHPSNIPVKLFQNRTSGSREDFSRIAYKNSILLPWQPVFDGIKFCEQFKKRTSQGTFLPSLVRFGLAVWEMLFKEIVEDARWTMDH